MAIKGYLSEITFVELLKIVGNHNGKLIIWNFADKKQYECIFYKQSVVYIDFCGKSVTTVEAAKDVFFELIMDGKSYYAFQHDSFPPDLHKPIISVAELVDFSVFETAEADDELLPHLNTRFETVNKVDFVLQGALADFWKSAIHLLHKGCSGYDICIELGLEEKTVRRNLYKLRIIGLIKPMRLFNAANSSAKPRMLKQGLSSLANRLNAGQKVHAVTNGQPPETDVVQPEISKAVNNSDWQNAYSNGNFPATQPSEPHQQPFSGVHNQPQTPLSAAPNQYQQPHSSEPVVPPNFLVQETEALPLPKVDSMVNGFNNQQVYNAASVNNPVDLQNSQSFVETAVTQNSSTYSVQVSVEEVPVTSGHPFNVSTNESYANGGKTQTDGKSFVPPARTTLIKRMLSSLFRN